LAAVAAALACASAQPAASQESIVWKPVREALLKIDQRPVKLWNVFRADKKTTIVLVQLGERHLVLDTEAKEIFEMNPVQFTRKGSELRSAPPGEKDKELRSADWVVRSTGRTQLIRVKIVAEGRVLEVQLPEKPDLRSLY
jgi:hypothetical protein